MGRKGTAWADDGTRGKTCQTFKDGEWVFSANFSTNHFAHIAWKGSKGVYLFGGQGADYKTTLITESGAQSLDNFLKNATYNGCGIDLKYKIVFTQCNGGMSGFMMKMALLRTCLVLMRLEWNMDVGDCPDLT